MAGFYGLRVARGALPAGRPRAAPCAPALARAGSRPRWRPPGPQPRQPLSRPAVVSLFPGSEPEPRGSGGREAERAARWCPRPGSLQDEEPWGRRSSSGLSLPFGGHPARWPPASLSPPPPLALRPPPRSPFTLSAVYCLSPPLPLAWPSAWYFLTFYNLL